MKKINKKELHEIFENLRKKDQNAYNKLYENYYKLIYGIVFSILKNQDDSEDITHEIFTKIYKLDVSKLPTNNEASWLFTVSKNECYLHLRKSKPNINIDEMYEIPESSNDIDKIIDIEYYNKLIKGLKEDEKLIVSLKVLSNFTFSKISQVMNIPIGTVQWKYYNAINSLRISVSSLVGAVVAFVIVLARGEILNNKQYLNDDSKDDYINDEITEEDIQDSTTQENDNTMNDENESNDIQINGTQSEENKNENINQDITENIPGTENTVIPDESIENNKNEVNIGNVEPSTPQQTEDFFIFKNSKIDSIQAAFIVIGIILLITFLTFFKIYQQKLKKKSSK